MVFVITWKTLTHFPTIYFSLYFCTKAKLLYFLNRLETVFGYIKVIHSYTHVPKCIFTMIENVNVIFYVIISIYFAICLTF